MFKHEMSKKIAKLAAKHRVTYKTLYNETRKNNKRRIKLWDMSAEKEDVAAFVKEAGQLDDVVIAKDITALHETLYPIGVIVEIDSISVTYND